MVSFIVVSGHKFFQSPLQFFGSEVIIEFHDVFHGSMIAFNLSLCLRMIRPAVTQILPTPAQDFKVGKISLPHLMYKACFVGKFIGCTQENVGWCRNESS